MAYSYKVVRDFINKEDELLEIAEKHNVDVSKDDTKAVILKKLEG